MNIETSAGKPQSAPKVVIIGLDGVPYSLLKDYIDQGVMPRLKEMAAAGALMPMTSTLPEVSSVAWASFMTGKNPAEHGIFGFMEVNRQTYDFQFPNFLSLKSPTFWEELSLPAVAFNIPQTYPARPTNGVLVSGFVALDLAKAVYPPRLLPYLQSLDYQLDVKSQLAATDPGAFFDNLAAVFATRCQALRHFYDTESWRIFIGTITETDRLHHFFFDSARGGAHHQVFLDFYRKLDAFLGEMYDRARADGALFLTCSDHGFTAIRSEVYVNNFLKEKGYLSIEGAAGLKGISPSSQAFCLEPARVYLHLKDKYSRGGVPAAAYESLRRELAELFRSLEKDGEPVVQRVFLKEEIFSGPFAAEAPDLYVLGRPGFDLKSALNREGLFGLSHFRGAHTYDDAHVFISDPNLAGRQKVGAIGEIPALAQAYLGA